ncbi:unnamed protein product [Brassica oleracea var. botrytis]|uniref:(rape) hypothetical protein n=1 Tax=Brassica napus TaxID=3708 RepID=A0A816RNN0_BRANA|nr:unnamed protein product [Brassica napus]
MSNLWRGNEIDQPHFKNIYLKEATCCGSLSSRWLDASKEDGRVWPWVL